MQVAWPQLPVGQGDSAMAPGRGRCRQTLAEAGRVPPHTHLHRDTQHTILLREKKLLEGHV